MTLNYLLHCVTKLEYPCIVMLGYPLWHPKCDNYYQAVAHLINGFFVCTLSINTQVWIKVSSKAKVHVIYRLHRRFVQSIGKVHQIYLLCRRLVPSRKKCIKNCFPPRQKLVTSTAKVHHIYIYRGIANDVKPFIGWPGLTMTIFHLFSYTNRHSRLSD